MGGEADVEKGQQRKLLLNTQVSMMRKSHTFYFEQPVCDQVTGDGAH